MFRGDRLQVLMSERGISQSELARRIGVSQTAIWKLLNEPAQGSKYTHRIAAELGTTAEYLMDESEAVSSDVAEARLSFAGLPVLSPADLGLVAIKEIDLALGAGGAYLDDGAVMEVERYFPEQWLRELTDAPVEQLVFARVRGDSMRPTIESGGIVIIDLRKKRIDEQDAIWAVAVADIGMVKRIWANSDGSYKIKSDNERVRPETAVDDEMYVLGRVVGGFSKF